ncbi:MAG: hypothetical protein ACXWUG_12145 [Polyangiales bacterium]
MNRRIVSAVFPLVLLVSVVGCHRHRPAEAAPPPVEAPPPPPPAPCDVIGTWQAQNPLPMGLGPQMIDIAAGDRPGVYNVRAHNGANVGVATVQSSTGTAVDTAVTNPFYKCTVGDCNTLTCAFTGGTAPAIFKRVQ